MSNKTSFQTIPISEATVPPSKDGLYQVYKNRWWAVTNMDEVLQYRGASAQCNENKKIVERLVNMENYPGSHVVFLETVWIPHECKDWR